MKKFLLLTMTVMFFAFSADAQTCTKSAKTACTKSKTACTKAATSADAQKAEFAQAVLLTGENVKVSQCASSGNEYRSYTCSASGSTTKQTIAKCGTVTTVKMDKEGNELSKEIAMLAEGEGVTKEAKSANPAATEAACSKSAAKACCSKSAGKSACTKSKKAVLTSGEVAPAKE